MVDFVLREIGDIFDAAGIEPLKDFQPPPSLYGQRRIFVEQHYANIDFRSHEDVSKVLHAFEDLIERLEQAKDVVIDPDPAVPQRTINRLLRRMERDGFNYQNGRFHSDMLRLLAIDAPSLIALTEESITEQIEKARAKIEARDHSGAIASAYTLLEGFLKELLRRTGTPFKENEGDIRELYKSAAETLNLNPAGENLENHLKTILQGLRSQVSAFFELANKASDRHVRHYNPARHHAKLVINAAFALCEFLLDSFEYQEKRKIQAMSGDG